MWLGKYTTTTTKKPTNGNITIKTLEFLLLNPQPPRRPPFVVVGAPPEKETKDPKSHKKLMCVIVYLPIVI
jgi:hypothetical protein